MPLPDAHLSRPAVLLPSAALTNEDVIARVRSNFTGTTGEWKTLELGLRYVFDRSGTHVRYLESDPAVSPGAFAAKAVSACLARNGLTPADVDLLVYGGIARENFEPATAAEVAGRIGATPLHALDVTCACAGLLEAIHVVAGHFALHPELQTAVVCAGEMFRDRISFDIQTLDQLALKAAGLTLGSAAAAFVVSRTPLAAGSARLVGLRHRTLAEHHGLCVAPVDGHFTSQSVELLALAAHVPPEVRALVSAAGWTPQEVDRYAFHQPSEAVLDTVFAELDVKPSARMITHRKYGNTASTAWALALDEHLRTAPAQAGDKIVLLSAAAGFTIVSAAAIWDH